MAQKKQGRGRNPIAAFFGFGIPKKQEPQRGITEKSAGKGSPLTAQPLETPVPARSFSWTHLFLIAAFIFCVVQVYNPVTTYLRQSSEISAAEQRIVSLQQEKQELQAQMNWWQDDNYVRQQARSRLFYVEPGETPYLVVGVDPAAIEADDTSASAKTAPKDSWTTKLWGSVQLSAELPDAEKAEQEAEADASATPAVEETTPDPSAFPSTPGQ